MTVNSAVSDIFFNLDHEDAKMANMKGEFIGYNKSELFNSAEWLIETLSLLVKNELPTAQELVEDFLSRV